MTKHLTPEIVSAFEQVRSHLQKLYDELSGLSKKNPDSPLNRFKVGIVNERLRVANTFLSGIHKPFETFAEFDEAELVTASDVVVVLSQYLNSLEGWRSSNVVKVVLDWYWNTKPPHIRSVAPTRFRKDD